MNSASGSADAADAVRNFLASLRSGGGGGGAQGGEGKLYPLLSDLLAPPVSVPVMRDSSEESIDTLLSFLPPTIFMLIQQAASGSADALAEPTPAAVEAAKEALSLGQKQALLEKVRSVFKTSSQFLKCLFL